MLDDSTLESERETPPGPQPRPWLFPHLAWEVVLLLAVLVVFGLAARRVPLVEQGDLLWTVAYLGLLATGFALSLRTAAPNVAVAGLAGISTLVYAHFVVNSGWPTTAAAAAALLVTGLGGGLFWLISELLVAPVWIVSLAGIGMVAPLGFAVQLPFDYYQGDPLIPGFAGGGAGVWFTLFLVVSVGGGAWLAMPSVRRGLASAQREGGGLRPRMLRLAGLLGSSLLAGLAGLVGVVATGTVAGRTGLEAVPTFTATDLWLVIAAVLLGGVAIRGYRGGIAGTALATILLVVTMVWLELAGAPPWTRWLVVALAVIAGLAANRVLATTRKPDTAVTP